tara:strand:+ start:9526 stop:10368 length:843 start_codon:yes stop_codon:yes gene_type:complete
MRINLKMNKNLFDLCKRYYLVTGAAGLLGRQHCEAILSANGIPVAIDLNEDGLVQMKKEIKETHNIDFPIFSCSITEINELNKLKDFLIKREIILSGIINNAAINPTMKEANKRSKNRLENYDIELWDLELNVGLKGSYLVVRTFADQLLSHKHNGVIINISSDLGLIAPDQRIYKKNGIEEKEQSVKPITYSVIKAGLIGMSKYFSTYFNGRIRSNALCPGGVENGQDEEFLTKVKSLIPAGRLAKVDEYRGTIIYMLSDASDYMNGAILSIDGGRTAW